MKTFLVKSTLFLSLCLTFAFNTKAETIIKPIDKTHIITQDRFIPVKPTHDINFQISGQINLAVLSPVYAFGGKTKILDKGDVIIGQYEASDLPSRTRVEVCVFRIITADGTSITSADRDCFGTLVDAQKRVGVENLNVQNMVYIQLFEDLDFTQIKAK